ncbi:tRNA pseudouridine(38/39) synthase [Linum perenne]
MAEEGTVVSLNYEIASLRARVNELEAENAELASRLSSCSCDQKGKELVESPMQCRSSLEPNGKMNPGPPKPRTRRKKKGASITGYDIGNVSHCPRRYIALKVMYFGARFYGFSAEAQMDPTVESEIFEALKETRLLVTDKKEAQYSRCGRTDKGVSAVGQVSLSDRGANGFQINRLTHYPWINTFSEAELDYVRVLNRALPKDIRIVGWCPVPTDFHARFSCSGRGYKYLFWRDTLDLQAMETAGKKFVGEHDFRNFCKMDAANVHHYMRRIDSFEISPAFMRFEGNQLYAIKIEGSAFLWHQVRCIVAVLFMIGQGFESPDVVDVLLDTGRLPRKPQYAMASEIPLILSRCEFEGLKFVCSPVAEEDLYMHFENECRAYQLQAAIYHEAMLSCLPSTTGEHQRRDGKIRKKAPHISLLSRPTEPSYEERRAKLKLEDGE